MNRILSIFGGETSYLEVALRHNLPIATLDKALRKASKEAGIIII